MLLLLLFLTDPFDPLNNTSLKREVFSRFLRSGQHGASKYPQPEFSIAIVQGSFSMNNFIEHQSVIVKSEGQYDCEIQMLVWLQVTNKIRIGHHSFT